MEDNLIKRLMLSIKCAVCGRHYEESRVNLLGHRDDMWFLTAACTACGTRCLVAVSIKDDGSHQVTDLTEKELEAFKELEAPGVDDVLDMHRFLADFNGDFNRLFEGGK